MNWLFLIEAVTSHGPVNAKRHAELESLFTPAIAGLVYVTAFPSRQSAARAIWSRSVGKLKSGLLMNPHTLFTTMAKTLSAPIERRRFSFFILFVLMFLLAGCQPSPPPTSSATWSSANLACCARRRVSQGRLPGASCRR